MPEEKKENKAAAKDSFTFSDKIKNSKPAASKSFANRISSKIGSDGKPKKTLFERTKRDAPFFIAAIVALLLLPFLYKYSGSVDEDPTMVTPATEDTLFDPNRSGFDGIGDPEGQIAQLSGRDSMDLIVGFGNKQEEVSDELPIRNDFERSGLDEDYGSTNNTAKEYNEKNVYRYKKQAAPATKAAFKKTNINPLRGAGLTSRSGGKLGVGMWGGGLKKAADKVKADAPKSSPKPVSLQPLQAAGKPSRSYFGQGAAAEARRSKDAMSKANAMQALMDAQMKPIEPGKIGGIGGGDFGGPGGGNGNLDRKFAFNGKEPWWWDMMKKRSQMEWEAEFNRKWDWIKWGDQLAQNILGGILNCLITGQDDGSMGSMFGEGAGGGKAPTCCGKKASKIAAILKQQTGLEFGKEACDNYVTYVGKDKCPGGWDDGNPSASNLGFVGARLHCLGVVGGGAAKYAAGAPDMAADGADGSSSCDQLASANVYYTRPQGEAMKWKKYHYVVARNYVPLGEKGKTLYLCDDNSHTLDFTCKYSSGVSSFSAEGRAADAQKLGRYVEQWNEQETVNGNSVYVNRASLLAAFKKLNPSCNLTEKSSASEVSTFLRKNLRSGAVSKKNDYSTFVDLNQERPENACVIYVGESDVFEYQKFQAAMTARLQELMAAQGVEGDAKKAFEDLDLFFIESMFSKYDMYDSRLWYGKKGMSKALPMKYEDFEQGYLYRRGTTSNAQKEGKSRRDVCKRKYRILDDRDGKIDTLIGHRCMFSNVNIKCQDNSNPATASVSVSKSFKGKAGDLQVRASYASFEKTDKGAAASVTANPQGSIVNPGADGKYLFNPGKDASAGTVRWNLYRSGNLISTASCDFNDGNPPNPEQKRDCVEGEQEDGEDENGCATRRICKNNTWTPFEKVDPNCVCKSGKEQSLPDQPQGCHWKRTCANNAWGEPFQTNPQDPACKGTTVPPAPVDKVNFYSRFTIMPTAAMAEPSRSEPGAQHAGSPWKTCKIDAMSGALPFMDDETAEYLKNAIAAYNKQAKETEMNGYAQQVPNGQATVAQVVDAMRIMAAAGNNSVPKNTVCAVANAIGRASKDPQVPTMSNMFGAFAAFINEDSSFYPSNYYIYEGESRVNKKRDERFYGCAGGKSVKKNGTDMSGYHYGHYNWNKNTYGDLDLNGRDRAPYINVLNTGIWKAFPLMELATVNGRPLFTRVSDKAGTTNTTIDDKNRQEYHTAYRGIFQSQQSCGYNGDTMSVQNALKYIETLCVNGASVKPGNGRAGTCGRASKESQYAPTLKAGI